MNSIARVSLTDYALQSCRELKNSTEKVEKERSEVKRSLAQRVGLVACQVMQYGGFWGGMACLTVGTFFSYSFFLFGAAGLVAFAVGVLARSRFEVFSPLEERLISTFKKSPFITHKEDLPAADQLKTFRTSLKYTPSFLSDVAKVNQEEIDKVTRQDNLSAYTFINFFGGKGLAEKLHAKQTLTAEEAARKEQVQAKISQVKVVYATSHLLEGIQNIAKGQFTEAKKNAEFINARKAVFPADLRQKVELLAAKMAEPSKELQDKIKQAVGKTFKLLDLDTVYKAVA